MIKKKSEIIDWAEQLLGLIWILGVFFLASTQIFTVKTLAESVEIVVDGIDTNSKVSQIKVNGEMYVEVVGIFQLLGWEVTIDNKGSISCIKDENSIILQGGSNEVIYNNKKITLENPVVEYEGRDYIECKYIAMEFGQRISWDGKSSIVIVSEDRTVKHDIKGDRNIVIVGDGIIVSIFQPFYKDTLLSGLSYANKMLMTNSPEEALKVYSQLLYSISENESPQEYVEILNNMGNAYILKGYKNNTSNNTMLAIDFYNKALEFSIGMNYTEKLDIFYNNMGNAFKTMYEVTHDVKFCKKAITCYIKALNTSTLSQIDKAYIFYNMGIIFGEADKTYMALLCHKIAYNIYSSALEVYTFETHEDKYAEINFYLGNIYKYIFNKFSSDTIFEKAEAFLKNSLKVWSIESYPINYANVYECLGDINKMRNDYKAQNNALEMYEESLKIFTQEEYLVEYGEICVDIGDTYLNMYKYNPSKEFSQKAVLSYEKALKIFNSYEYPFMYNYISQFCNN